MSIDSTQLRKGIVFEHDGKVFRVLKYSHVKKGRGLATVKVKVQNVEDGSVVEKTFSSKEKVAGVDLSYKSAQFLYGDDSVSHFMDNTDYSQFQVDNSKIKDELNFLTEGVKVKVGWLEDKIVSIDIPKKLKLVVTRTEPAVAGDTATAATKEAQLETGYALQVPLFIKQGERVVVNTEEGEYVGKG